MGLRCCGVMNLQLEPARIESFLDHAWRLIGQLRQWFAAWSLGSTDRDGLVELIRNLQLFWIKADDLELKRLARNSLAIEQFLERFCAGRLELTSENLNDVTAAVGSLQDLLLGLEAMREEPLITDLASLQKLERDTMKGFWSETSKRTIEVALVANELAHSTVTAHPHPNLLEVVPTQSHPRLTSETSFNDLKPFAENSFPAGVELSSSAATAPWPPAIRHVLSVREFQAAVHPIRISDNPSIATPSDANIQAGSETIYVPEPIEATIELRRVLIIEDSLFYRNLIGMALRSVGYDSDSIKSDANDFACIQDERFSDYCAILIGEPLTTEVADAVTSRRTANGVPVIRLMTSDNDESFPFTADASVTKSNPRQLIAALNHLLNPTSSVILSRRDADFEPSASTRDVELRVGQAPAINPNDTPPGLPRWLTGLCPSVGPHSPTNSIKIQKPEIMGATVLPSAVRPCSSDAFSHH